MTDNPTLDTADSLFEQGKFDQANAIYEMIDSHELENAASKLRIGEIALLSNNLEKAEDYLSRVLRINPDNNRAKSLLAESFIRRDMFDKASTMYFDLNREGIATTLRHFQDLTPYDISSEVSETSIDFVMKDPLPIVTLKVNEKERCNFLIDTGAASVILEEDFASEIGIESSDSFEGTFLGGKKAPVKQGFLESITLNEITVTNVPVDILKLKLVGMDIKGIIGTVLFYHFLTTLDYPNDKLILRRKDGKYKPKIKHSEKVYRMPIWMAGSHYAVAWGQVNEGPPNLLFVDTGGGGVGIMCSDRTIEEAGINLPDNEGREAMGGGGMAQVVPFNIEKASLGQAMRENVQGIYTKNFPLENAFGFHIGGIVSHQFLKAYSVTFDYDKMELILDP